MEELAIGVLLLGAISLYVIPHIQTFLAGVIPANLAANRFVQILAAGAVLGLGLWVLHIVGAGKYVSAVEEGKV